ncbi:MAG: NAD(P)-dependent oxidoreductase [Sphingobacteriaceae bacterium]
MEKIGFIGLGSMGHPMAKNLENAGVVLTVFNRTQEKAKAFAARSQIANTIPDLVEKSDIIFTMLTNDQAVEAVYDVLLECQIQGKLLIDMSTVSPRATATLAVEAESRGAWFLDAPVAGSTLPATEGSLSFMVGGTSEAFVRAEPYLKMMGRALKHLGPSGSGIAAKICINYYLSILYQGMAETVLFAERMGISREDMMSIINGSASGSGASKVKTNLIVNDKYPPSFSVNLMLKDVGLALSSGADFPMSEVLLRTYQGASQAGRGEQDVMAILPFLKEEPTGL